MKKKTRIKKKKKKKMNIEYFLIPSLITIKNAAKVALNTLTLKH
jgi:hypothetical protein